MSVSIKSLRFAQYGTVIIALIGTFTVVTSRSPTFPLVPILVFISVLILILLKLLENEKRNRFIRGSTFPSFLKTKLRTEHPGLTAKDADLVEHGLRQFFIANAKSKGQFVAMPSKIVDAMWHDFILHTKAYDAWCKNAFGKLLHHTPAEALSTSPGKAKRNDGLRRAWYWACKEESIDPRNPTRLPLLFALDKKLAIVGGFYYLPDCADILRKNADGGDGTTFYCGTSFSDVSGSSDSSSNNDGGYPGESGGFGGAEGGSGDGGSCGGGCGGGD